MKIGPVRAKLQDL